MSMINIELRKKNSNFNEVLFQNEFGVGIYLLLFSNYEYNFKRRIYFFKNTTIEVCNNIDNLISYIEKTRKPEEFYDQWSLMTIEKVIFAFSSMKEKLEGYGENYFVVCDYVLNIIHYSLESSIISPDKLIAENKYWILNLIKGNFNGKYLTYEEETQLNKFKKDFLFDIKDSIEINMLSTCKDFSILPIGNKRLLKFSLEFKINLSRKNEDLEQLLYPILDIIKIYELGYEHINKEKWKENLLEVMFYKIL